jgi:uncharacterized protein (DUF1330 family)
MNQRIALGLAMLAGGALGATAVNELHAQNKAPGAYAVIDIGEITDSEDYVKQLLPKTEPAAAAFDRKFITRTEKITAIDGTPPRRFVIIGFDSVDKAKAWNNSPAQTEINAMRRKWTKSRAFIVPVEDAN